MTSRLSSWLIAAVLSLGTAVPVHADLLDYTATLDFHFGTVAPFQLQASGQIAVNPDGRFTFPSGVFATTRILVPPQTPSEGVASIDFQMANAEGSFNGPANPGATMSLTGQAILHLQPFLGFPPLTIGLSPLGVGGASTVMGSNGSTQVTATLTGAPWQTGTFQQTGITRLGSTFARRTNTGQDLRTQGGEGVVTLVVPVYFTTRREGAFSEKSPVSSVLSITFTPEPARLIGEAVVIGMLLLLGSRQYRRRRPAATPGAG